MAVLPYMRLFVNDVLGSVAWNTMSIPQRAALVTLLMRQHQLGGLLPRSPAELRQLAGIWDGWETIWVPPLSTWFVEADGGLCDPIMRAHTLADMRSREAASEAGKKGARNRWKMGTPLGSPLGSPMPEHMRSQCPPSPSPSPSLSPAPAPEKKPEDKPRAPRKEASGPHADCIRHWEAEFARTRSGVKFIVQAKDGVAVANMLKVATPEEVRRRMTVLAEDPDAFAIKNATPAFLWSRWNSYAGAQKSGPGVKPTLKDLPFRDASTPYGSERRTAQ